MAGKLADEVGVFDLLVKVSDEGAAGHVGTGHVADGLHFRLAGLGVEDRNHPCDAAGFEYFLDGVVVFLLGDEGKEGLVVLEGAFVLGDDGQGGWMQVNLDGAGVLFLGLFGDVFDGGAVGVLDDVVPCHFIEVADAAAEQALEDEDIPLALQMGLVREVEVVDGVPLLGGDVDGGAVFVHAQLEAAEGVVGGVALLQRPVDEGTDDFHGIDQVVLAALLRVAVLGDGGIDGGVFLYGLALAVLIDREELVFVADEVADLLQLEVVQRFEGQVVAGVEFVALEDAFHHLVVAVTGDGEVGTVDELLVALEKAVLFFHGVVLREHEAVHDVLRPAILYGVALGGLEFFYQHVADVLDLGFRLLHGDDFRGEDALVDDNLALVFFEVLGEDEHPGLHALGEVPAAELDENF